MPDCSNLTCVQFSYFLMTYLKPLKEFSDTHQQHKLIVLNLLDDRTYGGNAQGCSRVFKDLGSAALLAITNVYSYCLEFFHLTLSWPVGFRFMCVRVCYIID